jgi:hypothetical protein
MNPHPHMNQTDQTEIGASRPILFLSARLLDIRSSSAGVAICGPGENVKGLPGQPPAGGSHTQNQDHSPSPGNPTGGNYSI